MAKVKALTLKQTVTRGESEEDCAHYVHCFSSSRKDQAVEAANHSNLDSCFLFFTRQKTLSVAVLEKSISFSCLQRIT